ncbi:LysM peptidoglycan-binding domain-containing protein [Heyndrickxia oleronia]|uniref:LysM peptidoglycan-binding domain-containing protein n=1 Tax=Heyndrickxia oleronia TaxID=38875 RepID=UPI00203B0E49|nr:LysM peptidoglycan-binding domain-containing protein [Heyndrickxia oleronia]
MKKPLVSVAATTILTTALAPQAFVYADTYKVQKGDTLWKIANKYGTSVAKLKEWNQLKSDNILLNQSLIVSTSSSKPNQSQSVSKPTVSDQSQAKTYVVKAGDTLSKIASLHNITLAQLQTWNNLNSYLIYPGDTLKVSQSTVSNPNSGSNSTSNASDVTPAAPTYTVKAGDTLGKISLELGMTIEELKKLNSLTSDLIYVGQTLITNSKSNQVTSPNNGSSSTGYSSQKLIDVAKKYLGTPYVWAGADPAGFDCSGYIYYAFNQAGVQIPRTSSEGYYGRSYYVNTPQLGDLVFFADTYKKGISHLGIYIGNNQFIHASDNGVQISSLDNSYWKAHFDGFKRLYIIN